MTALAIPNLDRLDDALRTSPCLRCRSWRVLRRGAFGGVIPTLSVAQSIRVFRALVG
jgi:hypothetical protein